MELSLADEIALLPSDEREALLDGIPPEQLAYDWSFWGRPSQQPPSVPFSLHLLLAGRGAGKAVALSTPIPTPAGWTAMGALRPGDEVFDEAGHPCRVTAVFDQPQPEDGCWRLVFSDGSEIIADGEHRWVTWTHRDRKQYLRHTGARDFPEDWPTYRQALWDRWGNVTGEIGPEVRTTTQIIGTFTHSTRGDRNHCIPLAGPLELPEAVLPLDPYLLGYWLGNGAKGSGTLIAGSKDGDFDGDHVEALVRGTGMDLSRRDLPDRGQSAIYVRGLRQILRGMGVLHDKHVPAAYLRASVEQRLSLLRGLMDSDGYADPTGKLVEFCSTVPRLARSVLEIVRSLSERPVLAEGRAMLEGRDYGPKYRVTWRPSRHNPFALPRKASRVRPLGAQGLRFRHRMLTAVERVDDQPMRCITVDSPNSMYLAGEAMIPTHNTATISEWVRTKVARHLPPTRGILLARTAADVRDVLVQGESGILARFPPSEAPVYEPSKRLVTFANGSTALCTSSEEPDQLRGPQSHWSAVDELAALRWLADDSGLTAWDNLRIATRLGDAPQITAATTPRRVPALQKVLDEASLTGNPHGILVTRGRTSDNVGNLSAGYVATIYGLYAGTRLARQELDGEMLGDVEGALWLLSAIDASRAVPPPGFWDRRPVVVVAVDPSVAEDPTDNCGIVVAAATPERDLFRRHAYVLEDRTVHGSPAIWARAVTDAARDYNAPVVAEVNQGGALVRDALVSLDPSIKVLPVRARYGKQTRAEPVALAYEQQRCHHAPRTGPGSADLSALEDELTTWTPDARKSPDRLDALVWAMTALLVRPPDGLHAGPLTASRPAVSSSSDSRLSPSGSRLSRRRARTLSLLLPGVLSPDSSSSLLPPGIPDDPFVARRAARARSSRP